mgnify:CR=1 FL=1
MSGSRPNIVFLMADDHQAMALGCAGHPDILTPNLDALAEAGTRFDRCYATSPLCMPSRATVFTGLHEYRHGVNFRPNSASVTAPLSNETWRRYSYAAALRRAGYRTGFAGKWGFPLAVEDRASEFDAWGGFEGHGQGSYTTAENPALAGYADEHPHVTRALGAFAGSFIKECDNDDRPFCLSISFKAPHTPHDNIDPADQVLYGGGKHLARRENWGADKAMLLPPQARLGRQRYLFHEWDDGHYNDHARAYYRLISGIDATVGVLRRELDRAGVADNTVIIYTSDNGYYCGSHGLGGKVLAHEESSRIPLIVVDPRRNPDGGGALSHAVVGTTDFAPTILDLAGLEAPPDVDGRSLVPILDQSEVTIHESLPLISNWGWAEDDRARCMAVVTQRAKYTFWCYGDNHIAPSEELYDLQQDGLELENLADSPDHADLLEHMRDLYDGHHAAWAAKCLDAEDFSRHKILFDRHTSWDKKTFRQPSFPDRARDELERLYRAEIGRRPS